MHALLLEQRPADSHTFVYTHTHTHTHTLSKVSKMDSWVILTKHLEQ